jgi:hypothetical protein
MTTKFKRNWDYKITQLSSFILTTEMSYCHGTKTHETTKTFVEQLNTNQHKYMYL